MQIGPIPITSAMLREHTRTKENSNITPYTVNEDNVVYRSVGPSPLIFNVKLIVPPYLYKQIEGLSEWKQIYPIVLNELYVDQLSVQGWGFIANVQLDEIINPVSHIQISFDVYIVEHDENCFLKMDYTNGIESNSTIDYTFDDVVNETVFTDHFGEFDTTPDIGVWETPVATSSFTGSISSNGTKLVLSGHSATSNNGQTIFTVTQNPANIPFTMDFNLEWAGVYASYPDQLFIGLYADKPVDGGDVWANDYVQANLYVTKTSAKIYYKKRYRNTTSNLVTPDTLSSSETNPKIRFVVDKNGKLTIYSDTDRNGEWTKVWGTKNPGWDINDNLYIVIGFSSWSTNTKSRYVDDIDLYNMIKTTPRNIVSFPPGCSRYQSMNSFGRNSEDGSFYACVNPNIDLIFQTTYANWDKGSVKVYNNYNENSEYRRVFNDEQVLRPTTWYAKNGLFKIYCPDTTHVNFDYWNGTSYVTLNQFRLGKGGSVVPIVFVKPHFISQDRCIIQINDTYWWLFRGKRHVLVNHPNTDLFYTEKNIYDFGDGNVVTRSSSGQAFVLPQTGNFYVNTYDSEDLYRLQIIQTTPTTLYSNKIQSTNITGILWYNTDEEALDSNNGYVRLAREFFNMVDTKITR